MNFGRSARAGRRGRNVPADAAKARTLVGTDTLAAHLDDPWWVIIDCRHNLSDVDAGERSYREAHIPGSRFLHLDRDLSGDKTGTNGRHPLPGVDALAKTLGAIGIDGRRQVVAYDQNTGMWASRLWWLLRWLGHDAVAVLDGGFDKWTAEARPTSADLPRLTATSFQPSTPGAVATTDEILGQLDHPTLTVVDARAPERYRGDIEPIDPVGGRIPGAVNRSYVQNLSTKGVFKAPALLRAEFDALLGNRAPVSIVHQCGSGVTACHNVLAMTVAGIDGSRLYPGSWSEWCADPRRPVARG